MHCAVAEPLIGHSDFPLAGSGVDGPAQSGQVAMRCIAESLSPQDADDTIAPAIGVWSAISKASKWIDKRGMCGR